MMQPVHHQSKEQDESHKRSIQKTASEQNLIGRIHGTRLNFTLLKGDDAWDAGNQQYEDGTADSRDHNRPSAALHAIKPHDHELSEGSSEEKQQNHRHFYEDHWE